MSADHHGSSAISERVRHVEALLEARGLVDEGEIDRRIDAFLAGGSPANGARIAARAWVDPGFRDRLLADANAAIRELGLSMSGGLQEQRLKVVANSADEHNVIVCTLCSCYPIALLGPSPAWYKSEAYRSRVVRDPRGVLAEFGLELPESTRISVWDASAESRYVVVPRRPEGTDGMSEEELAGLVTRKGLIGTANVSQRCADCLRGTADGMRAYSMDLRERVVAAVDGGMTQDQAAAIFGVSVNTVGRYLARRRDTGSLAPSVQRHGPTPEKKARLQAWLPARLQVAADATLAEHAAAFTAEHGVAVSLATMSRAITTLPADDPAQMLTPAGRQRRPGRPLKQKA